MSGGVVTGSSPEASSRRRELRAEAGRKGRGPSSGMSVRLKEKMPLRLDRDALRPAAALSRFLDCSAVNRTDVVAPLPEAVAVRV